MHSPVSKHRARKSTEFNLGRFISFRRCIGGRNTESSTSDRAPLTCAGPFGTERYIPLPVLLLDWWTICSKYGEEVGSSFLSEGMKHPSIRTFCL
eukprot:scaffold37386_cov69-Cyclotella_meneghiniana.AAC.6